MLLPLNVNICATTLSAGICLFSKNRLSFSFVLNDDENAFQQTATIRSH